MDTATFDITIERDAPPLRVTLADGRLQYDRSTEPGGFAGYLITLKKGTPGAFGHPVDPENITSAADAHCFLGRVFGAANVATVDGQEAIARGYQAKPPRGVF